MLAWRHAGVLGGAHNKGRCQPRILYPDHSSRPQDSNSKLVCLEGVKA